jgi:hypothetical protein
MVSKGRNIGRETEGGRAGEKRRWKRQKEREINKRQRGETAGGKSERDRKSETGRETELVRARERQRGKHREGNQGDRREKTGRDVEGETKERKVLPFRFELNILR